MSSAVSVAYAWLAAFAALGVGAVGGALAMAARHPLRPARRHGAHSLAHARARQRQRRRQADAVWADAVWADAAGSNASRGAVPGRAYERGVR